MFEQKDRSLQAKRDKIFQYGDRLEEWTFLMDIPNTCTRNSRTLKEKVYSPL
jgi:hypothetical protein